MKKVIRSRKHLALSAIILLIISIYVSCSKDHQADLIPITDLEGAKAFVDARLGKSSSNLFSAMKPEWGNVLVNEQDDEQVLEVSLSNPEKIFQSGNAIDRLSENEKAGNIRLVVIKNKTSQQVTGAAYMCILNEGRSTDLSGIQYKRIKNLTGKVLYYGLNGQFANGWQYANGKITHTIKPSTKEVYINSMAQMKLPEQGTAIGSKGGKVMLKQAIICYTTPVFNYGEVCAGPDGEQVCVPKLISVTYTEVCEGGGGSDGEGGEPPHNGGGGYNPPLPPDCAGKAGGTAYNSDCGCIGGDTGIEACPLELKTDSLKAKFPCADKLIAQPILTSAIMSKFVEPFLTPQRPTVTYLTDNTLPWGNATTWGTFKLGENGPDPTSGLGQSSIVRLNEKMLQNSSQLLMAATVVHETLHAYIKYNIATANYNYGNSDESNWMVGLNNFYLMSNLPANYSNHTMMLEDYFDKSMAVLQAWNAKQGFIYTTKDMAMAMLYGLDTYETGTSQAQINTINAAFQAVKTKYGIIASDLNTFNRANLYATTNKLPTTGCN